MLLAYLSIRSDNQHFSWGSFNFLCPLGHISYLIQVFQFTTCVTCFILDRNDLSIPLCRSSFYVLLLLVTCSCHSAQLICKSQQKGKLYCKSASWYDSTLKLICHVSACIHVEHLTVTIAQSTRMSQNRNFISYFMAGYFLFSISRFISFCTICIRMIVTFQ